MTSDEKPTKFFWLDMEFSGLEVSKNQIIEAGVIITDNSLKELTNYASAVSHEEASMRKSLLSDQFWGERPDQVAELLENMRHGKPLKEVELDLITLVEKYYLPGEAVYLAGSTIRMDRLFVDYWLPDFAKLLHHRMLDVTSFKLWSLASGGKEFLAPKDHRAVEDIRRSIAELKFYTGGRKLGP